MNGIWREEIYNFKRWMWQVSAYVTVQMYYTSIISMTLTLSERLEFLHLYGESLRKYSARLMLLVRDIFFGPNNGATNRED